MEGRCEVSDATTYGKACNRGDFWPNKKCKTMPWAGEPTPQTDALWSDEDGEAYVTMDFARDLERRVRAAESLLQWLLRECELSTPAYLNNGISAAKAHLEAARKEDGR